MSSTVRVIIVNTDESVASDLRAVLLSNQGVRIVAEVDEPAMLQQALEQFPAELLLIHLDPAPKAMMDIVEPLITAHKDRIAAIAMTEDRDAELVMRAMRAGMREFLWKPFPPEQLADIIHCVEAESGATGSKLGRLVCVVGTSGGVGATQLATNLATELVTVSSADGRGKEPGVRVACVDLDLRFGQVAIYFDAQPTWSIAELCDTPEQIDAHMIERAMFKHETGVHLLTRPADFGQAEQISAGQAASVLASLQEHYDYIVVDLPARFDGTARSVYDMADIYLLVLQLLVPSVRNADRILHHLDSTGYVGERIKLVCNRAGRDGGYLDPADVEATLRRKFDFVIPDDWKTSATAVNMGAPLAIEAPRTRLRQAYRDIAAALVRADDASDEAAETTAAETNKKGLFGFFAGAKT